MSIRWGYRCIQDGATSEAWFSHGEHLLRLCASCWPLIKELRARDTHGYLEIHRLISTHEEVWSFLAEHSAHDVELLNEYGDAKPLEEQEHKA